MLSAHRHLSPSDVPTVFSGWTGVATVSLVHHHDLPRLILLNAIWLAWFVVIHLRAGVRNGRILSEPANFYYGCAVAFYLLGILMGSVYYIVYAG